MFPRCEILTDQSHGRDDKNGVLPALGDGFCDGGEFNTKRCGFDAEDCRECNRRVEDPSKIGMYLHERAENLISIFSVKNSSIVPLSRFR